IDAGVELECDRCLKPISLPVKADYKLEYITNKDYEAGHAAELTEAELDLSVFNGESLDVDELVREQLLLAVPGHVLCSDDCKGICSNCGKELNLGACDCETKQIDPRWAALKKLSGS